MFTCHLELYTLHVTIILNLLFMKTNFLLAHRFKRIGWLLFIPGVILGILVMFFDFEPELLNINQFAIWSDGFIDKSHYFYLTKNNVLNELTGVLLIVGALFIAMSKEKYEDEYISKIRLESLVWAVYINYALLLLAMLFVFEGAFFTIMVFNIFTILIFFIIRYNWMLHKLKSGSQYEE